MLAVAIKEAFRTALTGRCDARPDLAASRIPLAINVPALRCRGGSALASRVFAPLGWTVGRQQPAPPAAEWGDSPYLDLRLTGELRLADALNHLYVLLPVLDDAKHYWVSTEEVDKLIRAGGDWLAGHPEKELITRRYLSHQSGSPGPRWPGWPKPTTPSPPNSTTRSPRTNDRTAKPLAVQRREAILAVLRERGAHRVGDLGCGAGVLTRDLLAEPAIEHVTAVDVSARALQLAARHLKLDRMPDKQRERLTHLPVLAHLPRRPAGRAGRRRADGGHRAPGPRPDSRARAGRVRRRRARRRRRHHPQRRVQRAFRHARNPARCGTGTTGSSGPAPQFRAWAGRVAAATATRSGSCRSARSTRGTARPPSWPSSTKGAEQP